MVTVTITHVWERNKSDQENLTGATESNTMDNGWMSGVCVCFTCVKVLAGFVGMHGAMTNRRLYCSQWRDYACAGKELVDG